MQNFLTKCVVTSFWSRTVLSGVGYMLNYCVFFRRSLSSYHLHRCSYFHECWSTIYSLLCLCSFMLLYGSKNAKRTLRVLKSVYVYLAKYWPKKNQGWSRGARNAYRILMLKLFGNRPLVRPRGGGGDEIKMDLTEIRCENERWNETGWGSCTVASFGISCVEPSDSATVVLSTQLVSVCLALS